MEQEGQNNNSESNFFRDGKAILWGKDIQVWDPYFWQFPAVWRLSEKAYIPTINFQMTLISVVGTFAWFYELTILRSNFLNTKPLEAYNPINIITAAAIVPSIISLQHAIVSCQRTFSLYSVIKEIINMRNPYSADIKTLLKENGIRESEQEEEFICRLVSIASQRIFTKKHDEENHSMYHYRRKSILQRLNCRIKWYFKMYKLVKDYTALNRH